MVTVTNKDNFETHINNPDKTVIIDFYADWCGPCKMLAPLLDELNEENDDIEVYKLNVDDEPELARRFGVASIPTLVSFKAGEEFKRVRGAMPKEVILEELL